MWFLWILIVICISSSHQQNNRYYYKQAIKFVGKAPPSAFYTETHNGYFEIKSLSGFNVEDNNDQSAKTFDDNFSLRAFHIGFPVKDDIVFEMEIAKENRTNCLRPFQILCLCYADNLETSSKERYGESKEWGEVINYCGKEHSVICYDYLRPPPVISSNPSIIKDSTKLFNLESGYQKMRKNPLGDDYKSLPIKITFTIKKHDPGNVHFSWAHIEETGVVDIRMFKEEIGYEDGGSMEYKIISVVPFQIFAPMCEVTWRFMNGKLMSKYPPYSIRFINATVDSKNLFVGDKRTHFIQEEKATTQTSAAPATTSMTASFITVFFCILFLFV